MQAVQFSPLNGRRRTILSFALISLLGLIIYSNSFHAEPQFDDDRTIFENPAIANFPDTYELWHTNPTRYVPLASFSLNHKFCKNDVVGYHIVNLLIHILNSFLVFLLVGITFQTPKLQGHPLKRDAGTLALFCALLFLSHPLQTQAVTYIVQRMTSMVALFYIGCVYFYAESRVRKSSSMYCLSLTAAVLSSMTKETSATLPLAILTYEFLFFTDRESRGKKVSRVLPFLFVPIFMFLLFINAPHSAGVKDLPRDTSAISRFDYLKTQFNVVRTYIRMLFLPFGQVLDRPYAVSHSLFEPRTFLSFLFLTSWVILAVKLIKSKPLIAFGIFWFFISLTVESSLIPIRDVYVEHRVYLAVPGFALALFTFLKERLPRSFFLGLSSALILLFGILSYQRNFVWKNSVTLWEDSAKKYPEGGRAHHNLGDAYMKKGETDKAAAEFEKAVRLIPNYPDGFNSLGLIYAQRKNYIKADEYYNKAIAINPKYTAAYINLAISHFEMKQMKEGERYLKTAFEIDPNLVEGFIVIGNWYFKNCNYKQARFYLEKGLRIHPDHPQGADIHSELEKMTPKPGQTLEDIEQKCQEEKELFETLDTLNQIKAISNIGKSTKELKVVKNISRY